MHPFHDLLAGFTAQRAEILAAIARALDSGRYILGPEVAAFEAEFARWLGVEHVIGVGSATEALQVALLALDVKPGDEVVLPALTAAPTAMAVCAVGATPVFADVEEDTFTICPRSLAKSLGPKTRVVIPVHLYGQCADMAGVRRAIGSAGVAILEDVAQAQGATFGGEMSGGMGRLGCFSFYPTKNLGAFGDGGAVTTRDADLAARVRRLRNYGAPGPAGEYDFAEPGLNARLDEIHAAMLRVRLTRLGAFNDRRRAIAARYRREVLSTRVTLPVEREDSRHVYHQFVIRCADRNALRAHLAQRGIETLIHYPRALHRVTGLRDRMRTTGCPVAEATVEQILSLPIYPELPDATQGEVIAAINAF